MFFLNLYTFKKSVALASSTGTSSDMKGRSGTIGVLLPLYAQSGAMGNGYHTRGDPIPPY